MASQYGTFGAPKTELLINGTWTDYSSRVRGATAINVTRGRANQQSNVSAQTCAFTLNNADGLFNNRNPTSALYGLLPRNTNVRVSAGSSTADQYVKAPYTDPTAIAGVVTVDKSSLDILGDIDVRVDMSPHSWRGRTMILASKWSASTQQSWVFFLSHDGTLQFRWTSGGTSATGHQSYTTTALGPASGRLAVRAALDVDNGASQNTTTFYTAPTLAGPWTSIGSATFSGTTSIFNSTSALTVAGGATDTQQIFGDSMGFGGRMYGFELRNGINGTLVAKMDPSAQALGATTWSDGLTTPNVWVLAGAGMRVTSDRIRFTGEASSLPQNWDKTGTDVTVPITASGMIRRLTQGNSKISSPMTYNFSQYATTSLWPLEDGTNSTQIASALAGTSPGRGTGVTYGNSNSGIPGTASVVIMNSGTSKLSGTCPVFNPSGSVSFVIYCRFQSLPSTPKVFCSFGATGLVKQVQIGISTTSWAISFYDGNGNLFTTDTSSIVGSDPSKGWVGVNVLLNQNGAGLEYSLRWEAVGGVAAGLGPTSIASGLAGRPVGFAVTADQDAAFQNASYAQVFLSSSNIDLSNDNFRKASNSWLNETAVARLNRLSDAYGVPIEINGFASDSAPMGYQPIDSFMNVIYDCAATDAGVLGEAKDALALTYRTRADLEQRLDATLDYSTSDLSDVPTPTEDDTAFTNDVTATRTGGSSVTVQIVEGNTSVNDPPSGVGDYPTTLTSNVATDAQLASAAGWAAITGSWDEARYPNVQVGMHRPEILLDDATFNALMALDLGDTVALANMPSFLLGAPSTVYELVQGYSETFDKFLWTMTFNCVPAGPYRSVGRLGTDFPLPPRLDSTGHTSSGTMTTTSTSITLVTPSMSAVWVDSTNYPGEFPFDIRMAGEVMTISAISGTSSPQTATVSARSVNGIVKTHAAGELVRLAYPFYLGR